MRISEKPRPDPDIRSLLYHPHQSDSKPGGSGPVAAPPASGKYNEAQIEDEETHYEEILDAIDSFVDALTDVLDENSSIPTAAYPCFDVLNIFNDCDSNYSSFDSGTFPVQASCLCYTARTNETATWAPKYYDGLISSCSDYASTQAQFSIGEITYTSGQSSLCSSAGDVRATPALVTPSPTSSKPSPTATPTSSPTAQNTPIPTSSSRPAYQNVGSGLLIAVLGLWLCEIMM